MANRAVKFGIIGVGQGGGRLAAEFKKLGYPVVAINTSPQDLEPLDIEHKVVLGEGGGAGRDIAVGNGAVERNKDKIISVLQRAFTDISHILICAGSSGGTGGGGVLPMVEIAKSLQHPVGVLTTFPLKSEDTRSKKNTIDVLKGLAAKVNSGDVAPFILMDNEKIIQNYPDLSTVEFWNKANAEVVKIFDLFNYLSAQNSAFTSLDPADYRKILNARGCMIFGATTMKSVDSEDSVSSVLVDNLEKGLLASGFNLLTATHAGMMIVGSEAMLSKMPRKAEEKAAVTMNRLLGSGTVYKGVYCPKKDIQYVEVLTMISGLQLPVARIKDLVEESKKQMQHLEKKTELTSIDDILKDVESAG